MLWHQIRSNSVQEGSTLICSLKGYRPSWCGRPRAGAWGHWSQCFWIQITENSSWGKAIKPQGLLSLPPDPLPRAGLCLKSKTVPPVGGQALKSVSLRQTIPVQAAGERGRQGQGRKFWVPGRSLSFHSIFLFCESHTTQNVFLGANGRQSQ